MGDGKYIPADCPSRETHLMIETNVNYITRLKFEEVLKARKSLFLNVLENPLPTTADANLVKKATTEVTSGYISSSPSSYACTIC